MIVTIQKLCMEILRHYLILGLSAVSGKRRIHIPLLKLITSAMKLFTI